MFDDHETIHVPEHRCLVDFLAFSRSLFCIRGGANFYFSVAFLPFPISSRMHVGIRGVVCCTCAHSLFCVLVLYSGGFLGFSYHHEKFFTLPMSSMVVGCREVVIGCDRIGFFLFYCYWLHRCF